MRVSAPSGTSRPMVPPLAWFLLAAAAQRPGRCTGKVSRLVAVGVAAASGWLLLGSLGRFRRSGTTLDPLTPARAGSLVTDGPNARTRNPMYLGMAGLLVSRALWRGRLSGLASAAAFAVAIDRFQIPAEEAALRQLFPGDYAEYAQRVPRWL